METAVVEAPSRWGVIFPFPLISGSFEGGRFSFQIRNPGPPESHQLLEPPCMRETRTFLSILQMKQSI